MLKLFRLLKKQISNFLAYQLQYSYAFLQSSQITLLKLVIGFSFCIVNIANTFGSNISCGCQLLKGIEEAFQCKLNVYNITNRLLA